MAMQVESFRFFEPGELTDQELRLDLVQKTPGNAALGYVPAYRFLMRVQGEIRPAGAIVLRAETNDRIALYRGHIGYEVYPPYRGHHYAMRACKLLLPLAKQHGLDPLWITCNPDNLPSRRTCELLGAEMVEIVDLPRDEEMFLMGERLKCRYRLLLH